MSTAGRCMAASTASGMTVGPGMARNSRPAATDIGGPVAVRGPMWRSMFRRGRQNHECLWDHQGVTLPQKPRLTAGVALARHAARDRRHHGVEALLVGAGIDELDVVPAGAAAGQVALAVKDV